MFVSSYVFFRDLIHVVVALYSEIGIVFCSAVILLLFFLCIPYLLCCKIIDIFSNSRVKKFSYCRFKSLFLWWRLPCCLLLRSHDYKMLFDWLKVGKLQQTGLPRRCMSQLEQTEFAVVCWSLLTRLH